ncbi:MAG: EFR1 family ferrodoxin [Acutalibacteraceae bacterium]
MVFYFTGTGNSAFGAKKVAGILGDDTLSLNERIKKQDNSPISSEKPFVIVTPTYCWQMPTVVRDYLKKTPLQGNQDIYFLLTCGGDIGNAEKYLRILCSETGMNFRGCGEIVMPENYVAMFACDTGEKAKTMIRAAAEKFEHYAAIIARGEDLPEIKVTAMGKLYSGPVNRFFFSCLVKDKKFTAESQCTACGLCVKKCPLNNITLTEGKPQWNGHCTHCMACMAYCPTGAIEYGKASRGKERYRIEDVVGSIQ